VDGSNSHSMDLSPLPLFRSVTHSRGGETSRSGSAFEFEFRRPKANSMSGASFTRAVFGSGSTPSASERVDQLDDISSENEEAIPAACVQVKVEAISQYKVCNPDPQDEDDDIWGCVFAAAVPQRLFLNNGFVAHSPMTWLYSCPASWCAGLNKPSTSSRTATDGHP
jgi:hypothetical protein